MMAWVIVLVGGIILLGSTLAAGFGYGIWENRNRLRAAWRVDDNAVIDIPDEVIDFETVPVCRTPDPLTLPSVIMSEQRTSTEWLVAVKMEQARALQANSHGLLYPPLAHNTIWTSDFNDLDRTTCVADPRWI